MLKLCNGSSLGSGGSKHCWGMLVEKTSRFENIDGLRAVAACLVICLHVGEVFSQLGNQSSSLLHTVPATLDFGRMGVLVFFLISGFLIPSSLKGERLEGLRKFAIRRFFRLYPLYWVSIPLSLFSMWWLFGRQVDVSTLLFNTTMMQHKLGYQDVSGLYWTLKIELYFYVICALLFALKLLDKEWVILGAAVLILPVHAGLKIIDGKNVSFLALLAHDMAFISIMFLGAVLRRYVDGKLSAPGRLVLAGACLFILIGFPALLAYIYATHDQVHGDVIKLLLPYPVALGVFLLFVWRNISFRPLSWLGEISYSLYLMHPVVFYTLYWAILQTDETSWLRQLSLPVYMAFVFAAIIGFSAFTYRFIEAPMIALGARLSRKPLAMAQPEPLAAA